jgi:mannose/cellobiose epimerase-like protein (N-acyl-D-glucosamine 2-epimerase family)
VNRRGENIDMAVKYDNTRQKASFFQHYALLGPAALADATRSADDLDFLIKCRNILDTKLWDSRPGLEGYFDIADYDWANPRGKGFTPTLDGITTHVLALYLLTGEAKYRERLIALGDEVVDRLVPTLKTRKAGFAENFDNNWIDTGNSFLFIGHVLKAAWCLDRIYLVEPKPAYREASEQLMANVWERLWDHENGGPFMIADSLSGAITNPVKENWTLEQGVTAGLINYYLTENPIALQMADQSMVFYDRFLTDRQYGESLTNVSADGATVLDSNKGAYYKSGYHHMELGYMVYLYGNLFLHKKPVSLYYFLEKETSDRTLVMNPVEIESNRLVIQSVELDGKPWTDFDGVNRVLRVPAGKGGEFRVSYAIAPTEGK